MAEGPPSPVLLDQWLLPWQVKEVDLESVEAERPEVLAGEGSLGLRLGCPCHQRVLKEVECPVVHRGVVGYLLVHLEEDTPTTRAGLVTSAPVVVRVLARRTRFQRATKIATIRALLVPA